MPSKRPSRSGASRLVAAFFAALLAVPLLATPATAQDAEPVPTPRQEAPGVPGLPASGTLATATSGTVTVFWTAPTGDAPVSYYKVMVKECKASKRADVDCKPIRGKTRNVRNGTTATFKKLKPGTTYNVWVRAINIWHKGPRLTGSVTTLAAPTFEDDSNDWRIWGYTIGQADQLSIGPLPTATGGNGALTYSIDGVNSCNRGNVNEGEGGGCGSAHKYNKNGAPLVDWQAAGFSFNAATRTLTSNTGSNAPTAAKVTGATSGRAAALPVTIPVWYTVTDADGVTTRLTLRIAVTDAPTLATVADQNLTVGTAASIQLPQADGVAWHKHTLAGEVPGLTLNTKGLLSGTPTAPGTATLTWTADAGQASDPSKTFTVTVGNAAGAPTAAPASVSATYNSINALATVAYSAVDGATGYVVQVIPDNSWPAFAVDRAPGNAYHANRATYPNARVGLSHDTNQPVSRLSPLALGSYKVRVAARNANGVGPFTEIPFVLSANPPAAPTGLTATQTKTGHVYDNGGRGNVALDWDDTPGAVGYVVQVVTIWSSHPGWPTSTSDYSTNVQRTTLTHNGSSATLTDIGRGNHEFRVAARDNQGRLGAWSTPVAFKVVAVYQDGLPPT